jgi:hypothetical protein
MSQEEWLRKALLSTGLGAALLLPFWWWAKKRAQKFTLEAEKLEKQNESNI